MEISACKDKFINNIWGRQMGFAGGVYYSRHGWSMGGHCYIVSLGASLYRCRKKALFLKSFHVWKCIPHTHTHTVSPCACSWRLCVKTWVKLRAGDCENRERDTTNEMKQTGGTKAERSEEKDRGGGGKRLDIWLPEFNKTLKEREHW